MCSPRRMHARLKYIGPEVMQAFVEYNAKLGKLAMVERCILQLNISSVDFHQVTPPPPGAMCRLQLTDGHRWLPCAASTSYGRALSACTIMGWVTTSRHLTT